MTEELPDEVLEVKATCAKLCGQVTSCPKIIEAVTNQFKVLLKSEIERLPFHLEFLQNISELMYTYRKQYHFIVQKL